MAEKELIHPSRFYMEYLKWYLGGLFVGGAAIALQVTGTLGQVGVPVPVLLGVAALLMAGWGEFHRHHVEYHFMDQRLKVKTGIFNRDVTSVRYERVTEVGLEKGPLERIFGIGDLEVNTAGKQGDTLELGGVRNPEKYREKIAQHTGQGTGRVDTGASDLNSTERLQSELGSVEMEREQLEEDYEEGRIGPDEYREQWYILEGRKREIEDLLELLGE